SRGLSALLGRIVPGGAAILLALRGVPRPPGTADCRHMPVCAASEPGNAHHGMGAEPATTEGAEMTRPMDEVDVETPEFDEAEQAVSAVPSWQDDEPDQVPAITEANEWDAQEQGRVVEFDDDYR